MPVIETTPELVERVYARSRKNVGVVRERLGRPLPADFAERLQAETFEAFRHGLRPVPGILEALERIPDPVCVASSGELTKMRFMLGLTGLLSNFEGRMFSATQVARGKPHPDLFLFAAREMSVPPQACVVVEDSEPGVCAARAAGMEVFGYAARSDPERLTAAGARVFREMSQLPTLF